MSNNKNNDNKKLNSTIAKFASAGLVSSVAFAVASPLIINAVNHQDSKNTAARAKLAGAAPATTATGNTIKDEKGHDIPIGLPAASLPKNTTPDFLYLLPAFGPKALEATQQSAEKIIPVLSKLYFEVFNNYGIDDDSLIDPYKQALSAAMFLSSFKGVSVTNNSTVQSDMAAAIKLLSDPKTVLDSYNKINGLGSVVDTKMTLNITRPSQVRNLLAAKGHQNGNSIDYMDQSSALLPLNDFGYKVAEINLDKLKAQKSLVFTYKDFANQTNGDYNIVISNENKEIEHFMANPSPKIDDLIKNQTIFVRDMKQVAAAPSANAIPGAGVFGNAKFKFVFDGKQTLSLLVFPDDTNKDTASRLEVGVSAFSDKDATKSTTLKYGLLDNTLSPMYIKRFEESDVPDASLGGAWDATKWMGSSLADIYGTDPKVRGGSGPQTQDSISLLTDGDVLDGKTIPVYSGVGTWANNVNTYSDVKGANANWLRLFFGDQTKMTKPFKFKGKLDSMNFGEGSPDGMSINYSAGTAAIKPTDGIVIRKSVAESSGISGLDSATIAVRTERVDNVSKKTEESYLKVDIGLNAGIISFDDKGAGSTDENPLKLDNPAAKIFFEDPFASATPTLPTLSKDLLQIRTSPEVTTADKNQELIANIVENWADKISDPTSNTRILTQKEFYDKVKQLPDYADSFKNLDDFNADLVSLNQGLNNLTTQKDIDNQKGLIIQQENQIKALVTAMMDKLPAWPTDPKGSFASPADAYMIFSEDYYKPLKDKMEKQQTGSFDPLKTNLDTFVYQYKQYSINDEGALVPPTVSTQGLWKYRDDKNDPLGLAAEKNSFNFELDDNDNPMQVAATGKNVYEHFVKYTNEIFRWEKDKLQLTDNIPEKDAYKVVDGSSLGWVQTAIVGKAGAAGKNILDISNALVKIWMGSGLSNAESAVITEFESGIGNMFPNWRKLIKDKGDATQPNFSTGSAEYIVSLQMIYSILQPYLIKCLNTIISTEVGNLDAAVLMSTKHAFQTFFKQDQNVLKISDNAIKYVNPTEDANKNMQFITAGDYSVTSAENGLESLKSVIKFIYASGISLENIGLTTDELKDFQLYAADVDANLSDEQLFDDVKSKSKFADFVSLLSKIVDHVLDNAGQTYVSLEDIAANIQKSAYDTGKGDRTAVADLTDTIRKTIEAIMSDAKDREIDVLGAKASYSYLESLVIGRNLYEIYSEYLKRIQPTDASDHSRDDEIKEITDFLAQNKQYDKSSIINLSFALGYYNIAYFIERLTNEKEIEPLADEMLKSDLTKSVQLKVDSGNEVVDFLSNPKTLAKYSFMGLGGALTLAGGSIFGLSFRKSIRMSRKNVIIERFIFMGIIGLGLALTLFGVIPSIL